eukprot:2454930-Karenia_brevis.AAC.1
MWKFCLPCSTKQIRRNSVPKICLVDLGKQLCVGILPLPLNQAEQYCRTPLRITFCLMLLTASRDMDEDTCLTPCQRLQGCRAELRGNSASPAQPSRSGEILFPRSAWLTLGGSFVWAFCLSHSTKLNSVHHKQEKRLHA